MYAYILTSIYYFDPLEIHKKCKLIHLVCIKSYHPLRKSGSCKALKPVSMMSEEFKCLTRTVHVKLFYPPSHLDCLGMSVILIFNRKLICFFLQPVALFVSWFCRMFYSCIFIKRREKDVFKGMKQEVNYESVDCTRNKKGTHGHWKVLKMFKLLDFCFVFLCDVSFLIRNHN